MPKIKSAKVTSQLRHDPLGAQMTREVGQFRAVKHAKTDEDDLQDEEEDMRQMPEALGKKIMEQARSQRMDEMKSNIRGAKGPGHRGGFAVERDAEEDDSDFEDDVNDDDDVSQEGDLIEVDGEDGAIGAGGNLSEAEERVLNAFLSGGQGERRTLADVIMEKIQEKQMQSMAQIEETDAVPPKVREVYTGVGQMLRTYRSGKLPKALKMLPHLQNWEEILWIARPDEWSAHAVYACTRIFASNLNTKMAQRFYNLVLLEKCRDDIREYNKLNYHLYAALRKALYKPGAFYKGVLLPLAQSGNCTLREATIIGSVIAKVSIPPQHSAAALVKLCEMPYSGSNSLFIRILLNKKYALPRRCIDALVRHFCSFESETRQLPVLWHHALLVFAQRYKFQLTDEQRNAMKGLLRAQQHYQITQEVRRELFSAIPGATGAEAMSMA